MNPILAMKVEGVASDPQRISVVTTGARYVFDLLQPRGILHCYQRIHGERLLAILHFSCPFTGMTVEHADAERCILHQCGLNLPYLRVQVNNDSLLEFYTHSWDGLITAQTEFASEYVAMRDGHVLAADGDGGIGYYPYQGLRHVVSAAKPNRQCRIGYRATGQLAASVLFISVFPPREHDPRRQGDWIAHHGSLQSSDFPPPTPSRQELQELARYANVLVLHEMIWQGKRTREGKQIVTGEDLHADACFCTASFVPFDEPALRACIKEAHALGMRVIPYMSPFYSVAKGRDFLEKVESVLNRYGFDGVYFDGVSLDLRDSYEIVRAARAILRDRLLYLHCTSDPIGDDIRCPFIETYADFTVRGEHRASLLTDGYLRYMISGHNVSNAVGHVFYCDLPMDLIAELVGEIPEFHVRCFLASPETERERLLKQKYFVKR